MEKYGIEGLLDNFGHFGYCKALHSMCVTYESNINEKIMDIYNEQFFNNRTCNTALNNKIIIKLIVNLSIITKNL